MTSPQEPQASGEGSAQADEAPSQALLPVSVPTVLLYCAPGPDLETLSARLLESGVRPVHIPRRELLPGPRNAPQHCLVELRLPGAEDYLRALAENGEPRSCIAVLGPDESRDKAFELGATTTVERPFSPSLVLAVVSAERKRRLIQQKSEVIVEHDRRVTTANAFEGLLRAVGQDVRTPLATALANMEFLKEQHRPDSSPVTAEEEQAIVADTLSSLQQIRAILEQVNALIPKDPPELKRLHLLAIAQQVLDGLAAKDAEIRLVGAPEVRGWGDETTLLEVTRTLVRRAIEHTPNDARAKVTIHVYAHDTEARLTVHDESPPSPDQPQRDPFHPGLTVRKSGQSVLSLTAARHAIVRMGGALNYVPRTQSGCAFRVRLRLAQPDEGRRPEI